MGCSIYNLANKNKKNFMISRKSIINNVGTFTRFTSNLKASLHSTRLLRTYSQKPLSLKSDDFSAKTSTNRYETLIILRPDLLDEERERQLAKFEAFTTRRRSRER